MKTRCYNPNCKAYKNYGERGIIICDEWKNNFKSFYEWAIQNGGALGLEIDRKENDGNYTPENCRFVSAKENCNNKSNTLYISYEGEKHSLLSICEKYGHNYKTILKRMKTHGYSFEEAISKKFNEMPRGEKSTKSKLTEKQVIELRHLYKTNAKEYPTRKLAKKYNISQAAVFYIIKGKNWK